MQCPDSAALILPVLPSLATADNANKRHASRFLHGSLTLPIEAQLALGPEERFMFIDTRSRRRPPRRFSYTCATRSKARQVFNHCLVPHHTRCPLPGRPPGLLKAVKSRNLRAGRRPLRRRRPPRERFFWGERGVHSQSAPDRVKSRMKDGAN